MVKKKNAGRKTSEISKILKVGHSYYVACSHEMKNKNLKEGDLVIPTLIKYEGKNDN